MATPIAAITFACSVHIALLIRNLKLYRRIDSKSTSSFEVIRLLLKVWTEPKTVRFLLRLGRGVIATHAVAGWVAHGTPPGEADAPTTPSPAPRTVAPTSVVAASTNSDGNQISLCSFRTSTSTLFTEQSRILGRPGPAPTAEMCMRAIAKFWCGDLPLWSRFLAVGHPGRGHREPGLHSAGADAPRRACAGRSRCSCSSRMSHGTWFC